MNHAVMPVIIVGFFALLILAMRVVYPAFLRAGHKIKAPGVDLTENALIGGVRQTLCIRGEDIANPAILFLHGGPGTPMIPFIHGWQYDLEKDFTIVQWDQRNTGRTFKLNDPDSVLKTLSIERAVEDVYEVSQYMKEKLGKAKIIIVGHSWGTVLGSAFVQKYPQNCSAYIGVGQATNMRDNERVGYQAALDAARGAGNKADITALEALAPYPPPKPYDESLNSEIYKLRKIQGKYKHAASGLTVLPLAFTSPYYTLSEIMVPLRGMEKLRCQEPLMRFLFDEYDLHDFGTAYEVPVFYIMGEHDYNTPYPLAKSFFEEISAPGKAFFTIPGAGHEPMLSNKAEFRRVMVEEIKPLLNGGA